MEKSQSLDNQLSDKLFQITEEMKKRCADKGYFNGLNFGPTSVIELITKDYIQCISLYINTGSKETYLDKIKWFKVIASGRMPLRNAKDDLIDFLRVLESVTLQYIEDDGRAAGAFSDFSKIIESVYCEV